MLLLKQTAVVLLFAVALTHAGVVRNVDDDSTVPKTEESTTFVNNADDKKPTSAEPALAEAEDAGVKIASLDPAPGTAFDDIEVTLVTVNDKKETTETSTTKVLEDNETPAVALSRDEGATIHIEGASLKPSSSETLENVDLVVLTDDITLDDADEEKTKENAKPLEKSSKLLLLSTPKLSEKAKIDEENIEEPTESDSKELNEEEESTTNAAESAEATTLKEEQEKDSKNDNDNGVIHFVTQLFKSSKPTAAEEAKSATEASNKNVENDAKDTKDLKPEEKINDSSDSDAISAATPLAAVAEEMSQQHNDNIASDVLIETESDYVLVDADAEQFGTFTHVDSDEHLQPIVESIEIVPTYLDEPLIVSYVHH